MAKGKKAAADGGRSIAPSIAADFAKPLGDPTLGGDETFEGQSTFDQFFAGDNMPVDISDTLFHFLNQKIDQEKNNAKRKALRRMKAMFLNGSNDFDADDIEQLRSKVRSQSPSDALSFLFMGTDYGHVLSGGQSDLEPIDEELAYLDKLITKMAGRENSNKVKAEVEKLLHEIFPTIVERMSSGFQLKQLSSGDLYLTYVFNDPRKIKRVRDRVTEKAIVKAMERLGIDRSLLDRAKSFLGLDETKMKFTQEQVLNIIKEEIAAVLSEDMEGPVESAIRMAADGKSEFYELADAAIDAGARDDEEVQEIVHSMLEAGVEGTDDRYLIAVDANGERVEFDLDDMDNDIWDRDDDRWQDALFTFVQD